MLTGAWINGGYRHGQQGTLGESLTSQDDNTGWALRSWKYELVYNGYRGKMILDTPAFGDAMLTEVKQFQADQGIADDGIIGPETGKRLLRKRLGTYALSYSVPVPVVTGIAAHESGFDVGAIGSVDHADRGCVQVHLYDGGSVHLSQAIRPAHAVPLLVAQMRRLTDLWDERAAVASWNIGEGSAEWWWQQGEPTTGSPSWWPADSGDMSARATAYVAAVLYVGSTTSY